MAPLGSSRPRREGHDGRTGASLSLSPHSPQEDVRAGMKRGQPGWTVLFRGGVVSVPGVSF